MNKVPDIRVVVTFKGADRIPAGPVGRIIGAIDDGILDSDKEEIRLLSRDVPEVSREFLKDLLEESDKSKFDGMYIERATDGSVVIGGSVAGFLIGLLLAGGGATLREAYLKSEIHRKAVDFLLSRSDVKVDEIIKSIEKRIFLQIDLEEEGIDFHCVRVDEAGHYRIDIVIEFFREFLPPRRELKVPSVDEGVEENSGMDASA